MVPIPFRKHHILVRGKWRETERLEKRFSENKHQLRENRNDALRKKMKISWKQMQYLSISISKTKQKSESSLNNIQSIAFFVSYQFYIFLCFFDIFMLLTCFWSPLDRPKCWYIHNSGALYSSLWELATRGFQPKRHQLA